MCVVVVGGAIGCLHELLLCQLFEFELAGCWMELAGKLVQHQLQPANPALPNRLCVFLQVMVRQQVQAVRAFVNGFCFIE
jgi:hypothetical protein